MDLERLYQDAGAWIAQDQDPETLTELQQLLSDAYEGSEVAQRELADRFSQRLSFGTAGLRGALGAGPNRMNRVSVAFAAAGVAQWLLDQHPADVHPTVIIGYDGRTKSEVFASDSAEILAGLGIQVHLMPQMTPTPLLAFAVKEMRASAGIMVTASHNPATDNGYKIYLGGAATDPYAGAQIISPIDQEISECIDRVAEDATFGSLPRGVYSLVDDSILQAYVSTTAAVVPAPESQLVVAYTAMHGVGAKIFDQVVNAAGFNAVIHQVDQDMPDPHFPTLVYPNPEEPHSLDLVYSLAREHSADLVIAHDPDADRLAVAIPDANSPERYRRLTGNEVGCLLGWWAVRKVTGGGRTQGTLAASLVSTPALEVLATHYKLDFQWTLSGFKWVARVPHLIYGFEEALGYLVNPRTVRDKDGISAALAFLSLASELADAGSNVQEHLDQFSTTFGFFDSTLITHRASHPLEITHMMDALRTTPPTEFAGIPVAQSDDLVAGFEGLPPANVLRFWLADGSRIMVRPSGTEPKLKMYFDVVAHEDTLERSKITAQHKLRDLTTACMELLGT